MKNCVNWTRVIANAGLAFATTLVATGFQAEASLLNAVLIGMVALFTEMKLETEPPAVSKARVILAKGMVF